MSAALIAALFAAVRLSSWGMALALVELSISRIADRALERNLSPTSRSLQQVEPEALIAMGLLLGLSIVMSFTLPILHSVNRIMTAMHSPVIDIAALWLLCLALFVMMHDLAYHRRRKLIWCAAWVFASHAFVLGALCIRWP